MLDSALQKVTLAVEEAMSHGGKKTPAPSRKPRSGKRGKRLPQSALLAFAMHHYKKGKKGGITGALKATYRKFGQSIGYYTFCEALDAQDKKALPKPTFPEAPKPQGLEKLAALLKELKVSTAVLDPVRNKWTFTQTKTVTTTV